MIPDLCRIIKYSTYRSSNNLYKILVFEFSSNNELVEIIYVGLMVFCRVELECFLRNIWRECIKCIWKWWTSKHRDMGVNGIYTVLVV